MRGTDAHATAGHSHRRGSLCACVSATVTSPTRRSSGQPPASRRLPLSSTLGLGYTPQSLKIATNWKEIMIDELERYKFITSQLKYFADRMRDSFKLYIQLATAIIGGFVWLKIQPVATQGAVVLSIVPPLLLLLGVLMSALVWFDYACWYGYRKAESALIGGRFPPSFPRSAWAEIFMTLSMLVTSGGGYCWLRGQV